MGDHGRLDREIAAHYAEVPERQRLGPLSLERVRSWELLTRHLPPAPAVVLDVGGAAGVYALPLAGRRYRVHLVDPVAVHVEQALLASGQQPEAPLAGATVGDARRLEWPDASVDAVLLLGPLYHLTDRADRIRALSEARRVLRPDGVLAAAAISRFASTLDGLLRGYLDDPAFEAIVERDLREGQHRNPTPPRAGPPRHPPRRDRTEPARGKLPPARHRRPLTRRDHGYSGPARYGPSSDRSGGPRRSVAVLA